MNFFYAKDDKLIGVEVARLGLEGARHAVTLTKGRIGDYYFWKMFLRPLHFQYRQ